MYSHPAAIPEEELLKQCEIGFGRTSGPGGQHRNKVETAVYITHLPTGTEASASERRKQFENRVMAIKRLREAIRIMEERGMLGESVLGIGPPLKLWVSEGAGAFVCVRGPNRG